MTWRDRLGEPKRTLARAGWALGDPLQRHLTEYVDGTNADPVLKQASIARTNSGSGNRR